MMDMASWDSEHSLLGLPEGYRSLTPLRFFRACICEGLGVVSGPVIWLQRKRKASFSELRESSLWPRLTWEAQLAADQDWGA